MAQVDVLITLSDGTAESRYSRSCSLESGKRLEYVFICCVVISAEVLVIVQVVVELQCALVLPNTAQWHCLIETTAGVCLGNEPQKVNGDGVHAGRGDHAGGKDVSPVGSGGCSSTATRSDGCRTSLPRRRIGSRIQHIRHKLVADGSVERAVSAEVASALSARRHRDRVA